MRGARFRVEAGGRSLRRLDRGPPAPPRLDIGGLTFRPASDGTLTADSRQQASRSLIRSVTSGQQVTHQVSIFRDALGYSVTLADPEGGGGKVRHLRAKMCFARPFKNRNPVFEACS